MELHPTQKIVAEDNHDYRVVCCGRQWGKTTLAVWEMLVCAHAKNGRKILYLATTLDQARDIAWANLKEATKTIWAKPPNESRLELYLRTQDGGVSEIFLDGVENAETIRGKQYDLLVVDEVAFMRGFDYIWQQILSPTLVFRKGKALFISTPQGFNHFHQMYERGQSGNPFWKSWKFPSSDNPYLPIEKVEQAKEELSEDAFAAEYLADFKKHSGLIYKDFDRNLHVLQPFELPDSWEIYCGIDFGDVHPFACLWIATDNEFNFFVVDELYGSDLRLDEVAGIYNANRYRQKVVTAWCDPSRPDWIKELLWRKVYLTKADKSLNQQFTSWVNLGIEKVAEKLKPTLGKKILTAPAGIFTDDTKWSKGIPSLFVFNTCQNTIREFETYHWKETRTTMEMQPMPEKTNDDCLDSLRYMLVSYKKPTVYTAPKNDVSNKDWSIGESTSYSPGQGQDPWSLENEF